MSKKIIFAAILSDGSWERLEFILTKTSVICRDSELVCSTPPDPKVPQTYTLPCYGLANFLLSEPVSPLNFKQMMEF